MSRCSFFQPPLRNALLVILLCGAAWVAFLPARGVWAPDEARYAEVAREMKERGEWLLPYLNGELYTQKPPLYFALIRLFSCCSEGVPPWAAKAPSTLAALGTLAVTAWLGFKLAGPTAAWLAPLLLGTMGKFAWQAQFGQIDMVLAFLVTAQIAIGWNLSTGAIARGPSLAGLALLGLLGVLAKGPVGCLLPWVILAGYCAARKDWPGLKRIGLPWAFFGVALGAALWLFAAGHLGGWDYPRSLLMKQTVQRYVEPWHHHAPWYYFLGILVTDSLPYALLLVPLAAPLIRKKAWREPEALLPLVWVAAYLLFFSISQGKRSVYILPLFPAVAILIALGLVRWQEGVWPKKGLVYALGFTSSLLLTGLGYLALETPGDFRGLLPAIYAGGGLLAASAGGAWFLAEKGRITAGISLLSAGFGVFLLAAVLPGVARLDDVKTPRFVTIAARPYLQSGGTLGVYPSLVPSVNYYLEAVTPLYRPGEERIATGFLSAHPRNLLLVQEDEWPLPVPPHKVLEKGRIGGDKYQIWTAPKVGAAQ